MCGTDYLLASLEASETFTRPGCKPTDRLLTHSFYVISPSTQFPGPSSTGSPPTSSASMLVQSGSATLSPPVRNDHSHGHIGAIIGGVCGCLASLAILTAAGFLYLRRRKQEDVTTEPDNGQLPDYETPMHSPGPHDPKHASSVSTPSVLFQPGNEAMTASMDEQIQELAVSDIIRPISTSSQASPVQNTAYQPYRSPNLAEVEG